MRSIIACGILVAYSGSCLAGSPVCGTLFVAASGGGHSVYRLPYHYGAGGVSLGAPALDPSLARIANLVTESSELTYTFPRVSMMSMNKESGACVLSGDYYPNTCGMSVRQFQSRLGRVVHVGSVDTGVPAQFGEPVMPPPGDGAPMFDSCGRRVIRGSELHTEHVRMPFSDQSSVIHDAFSRSYFGFDEGVLRQVLETDRANVASEFPIGNHLPAAMTADGKGRIIGLDAETNRLFVVDFSASGRIGDPSTFVVDVQIPVITSLKGELALILTEGGVPGDADADGTVGLGDLAEVAANFGHEGTLGDLSGDGLVDARDITQVISNIGRSCP